MLMRLAPLSAALLATACTLPMQQDRSAGNPERPNASQPRPIRLASDDVRALPAPPAHFAHVQPGIAPGLVKEFEYDSAVTGKRRKASVYLPAGYSAQSRYPVLYLLHGLAGTHNEWPGYVHAAPILDQLIAAGKAVPMIVVMPNGRALPDDRPASEERKFSAEHVAGFASFERDLLENLIPAIDRSFPTLPEAGARAIAGLSMGGGQALNFGLGHPESFSWVGGFSAAPNTRAATSLLPQAAGRPPAAAAVPVVRETGWSDRRLARIPSGAAPAGLAARLACRRLWP